MKSLSRRSFVAAALAASSCSKTAAMKRGDEEAFVCPPCGCSMDDVIFDAPGRCPDCGMTLEPKHEADLGFAPQRLARRAGRFLLPGRGSARITVHYYRPDKFAPSSPILLVIPGAGRNSAEYRNAWLGTARAQGVLVAALGYREEDYGFAAYHMGGVVQNLRFENMRTEQVNERARVVRLRDEDIRFDINADRTSWLFPDLDRVFDHIAAATASSRPGYDAFGHSAGAQILHRMAIFYPESKARRIVAANAGFYTFPDRRTPLVTGVAGTGLSDDDLRRAFATRLTLLLGEKDDGEEAGGTLLRTPLVDRQGSGRLQRGRSFYAFSRHKARELGANLRWSRKTVPGVGHDFAAMSLAASQFLY